MGVMAHGRPALRGRDPPSGRSAPQGGAASVPSPIGVPPITAPGGGPVGGSIASRRAGHNRARRPWLAIEPLRLVPATSSRPRAGRNPGAGGHRLAPAGTRSPVTLPDRGLPLECDFSCCEPAALRRECRRRYGSMRRLRPGAGGRPRTPSPRRPRNPRGRPRFLHVVARQHRGIRAVSWRRRPRAGHPSCTVPDASWRGRNSRSTKTHRPGTSAPCTISR